MFERLTRMGIGCQHDDFGESGIRQFRRHGEEEARRALPDIAGSDLRFGLLFQPAFEFLDRCRCRLDAGALGHAHFHQHFGTIRCREELLLDGSHANDRGGHDDANETTGQEFVTDRKFDEATQPAVIWRVVDRVVTTFHRLYLGQHLDAEIGRKDHRNEPRDDQCEPNDPEDVTGIFTGG
ncbi:hypothetical protein D3C86_1470490 [compost metagenome]